MAGEKFNLPLEALEILARIQQVPGLTKDLSDLLAAFEAHNHDAKYQPIGDYQPVGDYAAEVHTHTAAQVTEQANKRFMTDAERESLSSLGTSALQVKSCSLTGTNGYIKFTNGLMLQWGFLSTTGLSRYVYMPDSYIDGGYKVFFGIEVGNSNAVQSLFINNKNKSYFYAIGKFYDPTTGTSGYPGEAFNWFTIGNWK